MCFRHVQVHPGFKAFIKIKCAVFFCHMLCSSSRVLPNLSNACSLYAGLTVPSSHQTCCLRNENRIIAYLSYVLSIAKLCNAPVEEEDLFAGRCANNI